MGCAQQELERWSDAYVLYQGILRQNMKDDIAAMAMSKIKFLMLSHPDLPITRDDRMYYGLTSYYAKQYKVALEELEKVIGKPDDLSAKAAYFIAESYYRKREYTKAIKQYSVVAKDYPQSEYVESALFQTALGHGKINKTKKANELLAEFAAAHPESDLADNAAFQIAEYHRGKEQFKKAADAYGKMAAEYSDSNLADDALWNMGWCFVKLKDNDGSIKAFQRLLNEYPDSWLAGSAQFWIGVNHERMEKWRAAADAYKKVMNDGAWYYSDRAKRREQRLIDQGKVSKTFANAQYRKLRIDDSVPAWQNVSAPLSARTQALLDLRMFDDGVGELLTAEETGEGLESVYRNLSSIHKKMGDLYTSRNYAWRLSRLPQMKSKDGAMPGQIYSMLYPLAFRDIIFSNSKENKLDPLLIMAIMTEESHYNPDAVSWVGAMGLIQIMPPTGAEIARKLKIKSYKTEMLLQPEINIKMGTWYLAGQTNRLGKYVKEALVKEKVSESDRSYIVSMLATGAYNGGESRIRRWVKKYGLKDIDEFVEDIPIRQTRQYIKKVFNSYEVYKALYSDNG